MVQIGIVDFLLHEEKSAFDIEICAQDQTRIKSAIVIRRVQLKVRDYLVAGEGQVLRLL